MTSRPRPAHGVVVEDVDDEVALFRPDVDEVLLLNTTGGDIWRLSDGETSDEQIVTLLARSYGMTPDAIRDEVLELLNTLIVRGFLVDDATPVSDG